MEVWVKTNCSTYLPHMFGGPATTMTEQSLEGCNLNQSLRKASTQPGWWTGQQWYSNWWDLSLINFWGLCTFLCFLIIDSTHFTHANEWYGWMVVCIINTSNSINDFYRIYANPQLNLMILNICQILKFVWEIWFLPPIGLTIISIGNSGSAKL